MVLIEILLCLHIAQFTCSIEFFIFYILSIMKITENKIFREPGLKVGQIMLSCSKGKLHEAAWLASFGKLASESLWPPN